ncbi:MAG: hypothetical protein RBU25_10725 [Lentisphaeria bacterium]|jgi:tetratricopeptide (TPR) repeat protein|nr:hypothetical protein [Lentisphaeria bacterium]
MQTRLVPIALLAVAVLSAGCMTSSYLRKGDAAYAAGNPEEALRYYEQVNRRSDELRADPAFQERLRHIRMDVLVTQGRRDMTARSWDAAIAKFDGALALSPSFESAVRLRAEARRGAADEALERALQAADRNQLVEAGRLCDRGLAYVPDHTGLQRAKASLTAANHSPDEAAGLARAAEFANGQRWREAEASLAAVLELNPYQLTVRARLAAARGKLAEELRLLGVAQTQLRRGDLAAAEQQLADLRRQFPHNEEAKVLAADLAVKLGEARNLIASSRQAERDGRPGLALLRMQNARELWPLGVEDRELARLQGVLLQLYPLRLTWEAQGPDADLLRGPLGATLKQPPKSDQDSYVLVLQVARGASRTEQVGSEHLQHSYATSHIQPNPEFPHAQHMVEVRRAEERGARHRYDDAVRDLRRAERQIPPHDPHRAGTIERLEQRARWAGNEFRKAERETEMALSHLRNTPPQVEVVITQVLPYVQSTVRKTYDLSLVATMQFGGESVAGPVDLARSVVSEDSEIQGANPALGLPEDRLQLASDAELAASAADVLAKDAAEWAQSVAAEAWILQLEASAAELERQGLPDDAVELRLAAQTHRQQSGR